MDFVIAGVPAAIVVSVIVEAIKRLAKIEGDSAIAVAVAVGVAVALGTQAAQMWPGFGAVWHTVIAGALLGLAACGMFDIGQAVKSRFL